jgi:hypothetical protein
VNVARTYNSLAIAAGIRRLYIALRPCFCLAGCVSYTYVDSHSFRHIVGFVHTTMGSGTGSDDIPSVVKFSTVGVSIAPQVGGGHSVAIGYSTQTLVVLPDNSCIDLTAPGPCSALTKIDRQP